MPVLIDATHPLWSLVERLSSSAFVSAVALVGSRLSDFAAPDSDYDVFIYTAGDLADLRSEMAYELADASSWRSVREYAFGDEDAWRLGTGGPWLDVMYWSTTWAERQLDEMLVRHRAVLGTRLRSGGRSAWHSHCMSETRGTLTCRDARDIRIRTRYAETSSN